MLKMRINTFNDADDKQESSVVIDHDDFEMRKWFGRHTFWCARNGRSVTLQKADADQPITKPMPTNG